MSLVNLINKNPTLWGVGLCLLLAVFAGWLVKSGIDQKNGNANLHEICTEETKGTVTSYHETGKYSVNDKNEVSDTRQDFPIYEYEAGGRIYTVRSERYDSKGNRRYKLDEKLAVRYAPGSPEKHYLPAEEKDVDKNAWLCIGFGGFLLVFCGFAICKMIRER